MASEPMARMPVKNEAGTVKGREMASCNADLASSQPNTTTALSSKEGMLQGRLSSWGGAGPTKGSKEQGVGEYEEVDGEPCPCPCKERGGECC